MHRLTHYLLHGYGTRWHRIFAALDAAHSVAWYALSRAMRAREAHAGYCDGVMDLARTTYHVALGNSTPLDIAVAWIPGHARWYCGWCRTFTRPCVDGACPTCDVMRGRAKVI